MVWLFLTKLIMVLLIQQSNNNLKITILDFNLKEVEIYVKTKNYPNWEATKIFF